VKRHVPSLVSKGIRCVASYTVLWLVLMTRFSLFSPFKK
jgi:hypothetical protein